MSKELQALKRLRKCLKYGDDELGDVHYSKHKEDLDTIESELKNQKRKLDLISEVLVDVSKGNYADLNDAISEIREVLEDA